MSRIGGGLRKNAYELTYNKNNSKIKSQICLINDVNCLITSIEL